MLVEGVWLYLMIVRVFETGHSRIKKYCACAWGRPIIFCKPLASSFCWLSLSLVIKLFLSFYLFTVVIFSLYGKYVVIGPLYHHSIACTSSKIKGRSVFFKVFLVFNCQLYINFFNSQQKLMNIDSFFKVEARTGSLSKWDSSSENRPLWNESNSLFNWALNWFKQDFHLYLLWSHYLQVLTDMAQKQGK